jgi:hypothetical protein
MDRHDQDSVLAAWRVDEAANRRRHLARERDLLATELQLDHLWATWAATSTGVAVHTTTGREHRGRVVAVGADMVVVAPAAGAPVAVRTEHVAAVATAELTLTGAPLDGSATTMAELIAELADRAAETTLVSAGGAVATGRLEVVGSDVVVVRDLTGRRTYLRLDALSELSSMSMTSSSW